MATPRSVSNHLEAVFLVVLANFNLPLLITWTKFAKHPMPWISLITQLELANDTVQCMLWSCSCWYYTCQNYEISQTLPKAKFYKPSPILTSLTDQFFFQFSIFATCARVLLSKPAAHSVWLGGRLRSWKHHFFLFSFWSNLETLWSSHCRCCTRL